MSSINSVASSETGDPLLLTPGPLTTSKTVKEAMIHDWGSRDAAFCKINGEVADQLVEIINGQGDFVTVPLQGSGTFAIEAMLTTLVPSDGKVLVLMNGAYGKRAARILQISGRAHAVYETEEDTPPDVAMVDEILTADSSISHVFCVHCETTTGILNPIEELSAVVRRHGRSFLIDAMSSFGALPIDSRETHFDAVAASSNKCLQGVPGLGFVLVRKTALALAEGNATTLVLDLYDQFHTLERTKQYRFTPPIHVIAALHQALDEFRQEGGHLGRGKRYAENARILIDGMERLGFRTLLPADLQAPIIVTFHMPTHPNFDFDSFYDGLKNAGYVIYPGKLTIADSFRIGCIGALGGEEMRHFLQVVDAVLSDMDVDLKAAA